MIEFRQVTKRYDSDHTALRQVNFHLDRGELAFLTGHSGAGKSTLLKLIMVMERPTAGELIVGGQRLNSLPRRQIPYIRRHIGVVFQNHQLLFDRAALDKVGLLNKEKMNPLQLSGGEQQRVGIARAVVNKPPVLLADEPTGNLDPELSADIMHLFTEFSQVGVTVLIATHDIALINEMGRRKLTLDHGQLIAGGHAPAAGGASGY